ncbi:MAG: class I SAM-dependent methyltransferase [Chloroflexi bacterium]|nr:class I SAM-dependent methyltransferase [Chloroflexota bacterium]
MTVAAPAKKSSSPFAGLARRVAIRVVSSLKVGRLTVEFPDGSTAQYGPEYATRKATLRIHSDDFFVRVIRGGEIGLGESYMDGLWSSPDLVALLELALAARNDVSASAKRWSFLSRLRNRRRHVARRNSVQMSRENIHDHYDLGNDFFRLFLDETMTYSCAVFASPGQPLKEAQINKYRALCERVEMRQGDRVLEIGTGWGGFAMFMAQTYNAKVTTITISEEQFKLARERIATAGLSDRIDVQFLDYRKVTGQYDRIVSIEMFEAVGAEYFETFFKTCEAALKPGGRMGMQVITVPERGFETQKNGVNWLQKHIFPGGLLPSLAAMEEALQCTSLIITRVEDIGPHYAVTLRRWRERFFENLPAVRALGFTDVFIRKWEYYLASCEAAFSTRSIGDLQLVFEKPSH